MGNKLPIRTSLNTLAYSLSPQFFLNLRARSNTFSHRFNIKE